MSEFNYRHLRYFWMVAKTGSIARASEQLHLTPQSISGQLGEFEDKLGVDLFRRAGRALELTDAGRRILGMAEEIFAIGNQLLATLHDDATRSAVPFRLGIADSVSKSMVGTSLNIPIDSLTEAERICQIACSFSNLISVFVGWIFTSISLGSTSKYRK